jgi:PEP-CTERM/exosortase A-associated glycosyltransferase
MSPMRILHVLDHSLPLHSGYTFRTAAILREQRALGWETLQLTTPRHGRSATEEEEASGLRFLRTSFVPGWRSRIPAAGAFLDEMSATERRLDQVIARHRPDLLHAHSPVLNALPAIAAGRRHGIPVVYEVRACWEDAAVDHGSTREGSPRYRATRALETYALRRADAVTVICEGLRREFESRGIPADKITVIPNAVEVHNFRFGAQPDAELRRALGLEGATVLGFIGSFYAYEGLDLLLEALPRLLPARPQLRILLVGGGPQEAALKTQVQRLGIADKVIFTGRVPHAEVQRYYDLVDLLAYPRHPMRLTELVTPLKPLEAMAQGQILVASDVGGHRELIRDGDTGYLFAAGSVGALAQSIERALSLRREWDAMRLRGRRFVEVERTWAHSVARYRDVYGRLLATAGGGNAVSAVS